MSQWPYSFEVLEVARLFVDETYQRPLTNLARRIEQNFDPALVGTLVISAREDGGYAIVDGQTRASAILNLAAEDAAPLGVPCLVYRGLTLADEASLFARLQKERRGIASFHRFRAALVAGEEEAVAIEQIVNAAGYEIGPTSAGQLSAVAALERVYRRTPETLSRTLAICRGTWSDKFVPPGDILRGLGYLLTWAHVDDERLIECLSAVTPESLKRRASALREGMGHGGGSDKYMAQAIAAEYKPRLELAA